MVNFSKDWAAMDDHHWYMVKLEGCNELFLVYVVDGQFIVDDIAGGSQVYITSDVEMYCLAHITEV